MEMENRKNCHCNDEKINGICCDVKNCIHHGEGNCCTAEEINIGPSFATSCADTVCSTFKQKKN